MNHQSSRENIRSYYDEFMYDRVIDQYFEHSDFHNVGLWRGDTDAAADACRALIAELIALSPPNPQRVLEVGCGKGATTRELRAHWPHAEITAIDVSETQLETSIRNCPDATFMLMDACNMTFPDSSFDVMISVEAAFQFPSRRRFMEQTRRVLKPGGRLVLQDLLHHQQGGGAPIVLPDTLRGDNTRSGRAKSEVNQRILEPATLLPAENYLTSPQEYEELVRAAGFKNCRIIDVTAEGPRRFYPHFLSQLADRNAWEGYDPDHLRMLRVGARLFARNVSYCILVRADA